MTSRMNLISPVLCLCRLFIVSLSVIAGCSHTATDLPDLGQVTGVITLDDQPLEGATVTFVPEDGRPSKATTDASGKYELLYIDDTKGAFIGKHKVTVSKMVDKAVESGKKLSPEEIQSGNKEESIIAKYNTSTTLAADVKAGPNTFDFKITSK